MKFSAIHAAIKIGQIIGFDAMEITSIRPEDGSGNRWLFTRNIGKEIYIDLIAQEWKQVPGATNN
jgi:hypothetical protein